MKKFYLLLVVCFIATVVTAQKNLPDSLKSKYHMMTYEELNRSKTSSEFRSITTTAPPSGEVRSIAEWERNQGVIVAYPNGGFGIPIDLIKKFASHVHVYIIYNKSSNLSTIQNLMSSNGVNTNNVSYHNIPVDSYWSRDYSPWFIASEDDPIVGIVNFDYNRPYRPNDNNVPVNFASVLNVPVYGMNVVHTGGNYMSDGMGKASSTSLVYSENSASNSTVDSRMENYLGITDYMVVDDPMDDYIEHVDCWGKFLDVDKIMIGQVPESDYRYSDYEAVADYYANHPSSYGNNYEVYRIYSPQGQPYTNSLIMNNKVYVPVPTGNGSSWNDEAIASYQDAMPGYEIVAVPNTTAPSWQSTDALHCRAHEVPDLEMLKITHIPWHGFVASMRSFQINAKVNSYGDHTLYADSIRLYYSVNNGNWQHVLMNNTYEDNYTASIPGQSNGTQIRYIIHAADQSGRSENHPFIGFDDPHQFTVGSLSQTALTVSSKLSVFPNPATTEISIALHYFDSSETNVSIYDIKGNLVKNYQLKNTDDYTLLRCNIENLVSGTYIIKVDGNGEGISSKFIKK